MEKYSAKSKTIARERLQSTNQALTSLTNRKREAEEAPDYNNQAFKQKKVSKRCVTSCYTENLQKVNIQIRIFKFKIIFCSCFFAKNTVYNRNLFSIALILMLTP